jgi:hypothetical protein
MLTCAVRSCSQQELRSLYPPSLEKFWHVYEGDFIRAAGGLDGHGEVWLRANLAGTPRATA